MQRAAGLVVTHTLQSARAKLREAVSSIHRTISSKKNKINAYRRCTPGTDERAKKHSQTATKCGVGPKFTLRLLGNFPVGGKVFAFCFQLFGFLYSLRYWKQASVLGLKRAYMPQARAIRFQDPLKWVIHAIA